MDLQVARFLMKTVSQLGSGKAPSGTTAYMGRAKHLLQCSSGVRNGDFFMDTTIIFILFISTCFLNLSWLRM